MPIDERIVLRGAPKKMFHKRVKSRKILRNLPMALFGDAN